MTPYKPAILLSHSADGRTASQFICEVEEELDAGFASGDFAADSHDDELFPIRHDVCRTCKHST